MDCTTFKNVFWSNYLLIENEFLEATKYVFLDKDNFLTYSDHFQKLIISIASEVETVSKELYKFIFGQQSNVFIDIINKLSENDLKLKTMRIDVLHNNNYFYPLKANINGKYKPNWWSVYNKLKHNRFGKIKLGKHNYDQIEIDELSEDYKWFKEYEDNGKEYYKLANLKFTIESLSTLYQLEIYFYKKLADKEHNPMDCIGPTSQIFKCDGFTSTIYIGENMFYTKDED